MRNYDPEQLLNDKMVRLEGLVYETMERISSFEAKLLTANRRLTHLEASLKRAHTSLEYVKKRLRAKVSKKPVAKLEKKKPDDLPSFT